MYEANYKAPGLMRLKSQTDTPLKRVDSKKREQKEEEKEEEKVTYAFFVSKGYLYRFYLISLQLELSAIHVLLNTVCV